MELRWGWVVIAGLVALGAIVLAAFLWPMHQQPRRLRPLAWVGRLTELPEYARAYRRYRILLAAIAATTVAVLLCAIVATARPVSSQATTAEINRAHPEDVMLCLQDDPASHDASVMLSYFRDQAADFDSQRLGLTSRTIRVIPLTRDYPFLQDELGRYASLERLRSTQNPKPEDAAVLQRAQHEFGRAVSYSDYRLTVNDALAMCMKGFPGVGKPSDTRRSVIYMGPAGGSEAPIFSDDALAALARTSGVQVNVLTRTTLDASGGLSGVATATGGRFISYVAAADAKGGNGGDAQDTQGTLDKALRNHLDDIRAHPPAVTSSDGTILVEQLRDRPNLVLTIALVIVIVFSISLAGVRR
ncbi:MULTISPECIES: hypothetical protein [unclassified Mycolicibacterium]|uniref:hypothetical protein n=1 Tax=unclassified Mycolicibacterium TaxID=2636767 RepID=UPI0012DC8E8F|nr:MULTISPECIES: hypothetical protein [unclassified Mycolicibacterium]MUL81796.1 hypothetical protein [Mycolicibacterium sp. CBMA 329]MUL87562.1 hypothetical protein [Mycolicibacterium sp. CBMA 331]MUL99574.1 hypothetical protein [Mycolicibacterium sp. CBMA 334]MUM26672.1 hypothetical protein [Mycolicibacterium sp. CBMA 295]MUM37859.1 hypothetical protein [Mycolicibacterium sp. CBMA 247]